MKSSVLLSIFGVFAALGAGVLVLWAVPAAAEDPQASAAVSSQVSVAGLFAAAAATAISSLAAAYAVAKVGSAAAGAVTEKPELFGRLLVLVGLAEGIAIYGLIVSILILNRLG